MGILSPRGAPFGEPKESSSNAEVELLRMELVRTSPLSGEAKKGNIAEKERALVHKDNAAVHVSMGGTGVAVGKEENIIAVMERSEEKVILGVEAKGDVMWGPWKASGWP